MREPLYYRDKGVTAISGEALNMLEREFDKLRDEMDPLLQRAAASANEQCSVLAAAVIFKQLSDMCIDFASRRRCVLGVVKPEGFVPIVRHQERGGFDRS